MTEDRVTCPTCRGEGGMHITGGDRGEWLWYDCTVCEGAGTVTEDVAECAPLSRADEEEARGEDRVRDASC